LSWKFTAACAIPSAAYLACSSKCLVKHIIIKIDITILQFNNSY
jgi:hypothetical protein